MSKTSTKKTHRINNNEGCRNLLPIEITIENTEVPEKGPARFGFVGYNGGTVNVQDYGLEYPLVYDIETMITNNKNPVLYRHKEEVGHTFEVRKPENKQVTGKGLLSVPNEKSKEISEGLKNEFPYQGSLGVDAQTKNIFLTPAGKTLFANGRTFNGPVYLAKHTKLRELTFTTFGRDETTSFEFLNEEERMRIKNEALRINNEQPDNADDKKSDDKKLDEKLDLKNEKKEDKKEDKKNPVVFNNEKNDEELRLENERLKLENDQLKNAQINKTVVLYNQLIREFPDNADIVEKGFDEGLTADQIRNNVKLHRYENNMPALPNTVKPKDKDDAFTKQMQLRMCLSLNSDPEFLESKFGKEAVEKAAEMPLISPGEMVVRVANHLGGNFDSYSDVDAICKFIKNHHQANEMAETLRLENAPGFSTTSLANVLESVSQIQMEERWKLDPPFAPQVLKEGSNKDFRPTQKMRVQGGEPWEQTKKDGTIKHTTFGTETFYTTKLDTVAQMLVLDRQTIINDDMDVILDMMDAMLEGAMMVPDMKLGVLLFKAAAAASFWVNADNSNTSTALNRTNLSARYKKLMTYTETRGAFSWKNMVNDKWWLVVDPTMEETAFELLQQTEIVGNTTANTIQGRKNFWAGKFAVKTFAQMANTSLFGSGTFVSANTWFLWPQSARFAPYIISYLKGRKRPTVERITLPDNILGSGVRGYWDVEVDERERLVIDRNNG